jgi:pantoate kinase
MARAPTVSNFLGESERFTDRLGIAPPPVRRTIDALRAAGVRAAQAMFGQSLFIVAPNVVARRRALGVLERRHLPAVELHAAPRGARSTFVPARALFGRVYGALAPPARASRRLETVF